MSVPSGRRAHALPDVPPQDPRTLPKVPRLTLQPQNAVLKLSRSLEFEHEVRREDGIAGGAFRATIRMKWWKMDVEKMVRQVGWGILRQYKVGFSQRFSFSPLSLP